MRTSNDLILNLTNVTTDQFSEAVDLTNIYLYSVQLSWTSTTAAATISLQATNYENPLSTDWITISATSQTVNNNSSSVMIKETDVSYKKFRIFVDHSSGTITTVTAKFNAKGV